MLKEISPSTKGIRLNLLYATPDNFTRNVVYKNAFCFLHTDAYDALLKARDYANSLGLGLTIFDGFRPTEAQDKLWEICPDPTFVADPKKGSSHSRGVAVDLTLFDLNTKKDLNMGTPFDDFTPLSFHADLSLPPEIQKNRLLLMGIMTQAGFHFYDKEWWHYQLPDAREKYPLLSDKESPRPLM